MPSLQASPHMPALDPLAFRVTRRYVAHIHAERIAREVHRRREGLVTVRGGGRGGGRAVLRSARFSF
jgi:hypothetical protein